MASIVERGKSDFPPMVRRSPPSLAPMSPDRTPPAREAFSLSTSKLPPSTSGNTAGRDASLTALARLLGRQVAKDLLADLTLEHSSEDTP